jgi:hypothetical protein
MEAGLSNMHVRKKCFFKKENDEFMKSRCELMNMFPTPTTKSAGFYAIFGGFE